MKEYEIYKKVRRYIKENHMLQMGDLVVIGVSGGADSMALADLLFRMKEEWKLGIVVLHVNHGIRGEEALRDQKRVEKFCLERKLTCRVFFYNIPEIARQEHLGVEEAGRKYREQAFYKIVEEFKDHTVKLALAHNENDLAETVLHHLSRGTGLRGLGGIVPVSGKKIRPVLCLEREEIESYCREQKLDYILDSSNLTDHYTRNRIRHHILPSLKEMVNSEVVHHLAETAAQAAEAEAYLREQADLLLEKQKQTEGSFLFGEDFFQEPLILKKYAVRRALELLAGKQKDLTSSHIGDILNLWEKETSRKIMLPYQLSAERSYEGVLLRKKGQEKMQKRQDIYPVPESGILTCPWGEFEIQVFSYEGQKIIENKYTKWFDYDRIRSGCVIRNRREGDYLILNQNGQKKKLNRYLIDEKIPSEIRDQIPVLAYGSEIIWVPGGRISENYKINVNTRNVFQVEYKRGDIYERKN